MKIIGFGKFEKGGSHAVIKQGRKTVALCNKKLIDVNDTINIMQVTCKKCQKLKSYRELLAETVDNKFSEKEDSTNAEPINEIISSEEQMETIEEKLEDTKELLLPEEVEINSEEQKVKEQLLEQTTPQYQKIEIIVSEDPEDTPKIKDVISIDNEILKEKPFASITQELEFAEAIKNFSGQFIAEVTSNLSYDISHRLGETIFFSGISKEKIANCLVMLNNVKDQWSGRGSVSKSWLDKIKKAYSIGYCINGDSAEREIKQLKELSSSYEKLHIEFEKQNLEMMHLTNAKRAIEIELDNYKKELTKLQKMLENNDLVNQEKISEKIKKPLTLKIRDDIRDSILSKKLMPKLKIRRDIIERIRKNGSSKK